MSDLTHEEEFLTHLTAAGVLSARLTRALATQSAPAADVKALKATPPPAVAPRRACPGKAALWS